MEIINNFRRDLPNSTAILVLGILSLVFCWCFGILGLILGIIAVVMAGTQRRIYLESPSEYTSTSFSSVNVGRICGIIAICISACVFLFFVLMMTGLVALGLALACLRI